MKIWNELDNNIFFNKIFSAHINIGEISLFSLQINNDQPTLGLGFDISEFPDNLPEKWKNKGYNTCRIGLDCSDIWDLNIKNIPTKEKLLIKIKKTKDFFEFHAVSKNALITFKTKYLSLCGPSVYINDLDTEL